MEGEGGAVDSAPETPDSEPVAGPSVPSITSTVSGLPISPAYAGARVGFSFFPSRSMTFKTSVVRHRTPPSAVSYSNTYVPQRRGNVSATVNQERNLIGDGEMYQDPLDNFKPQSFKEGNTTTDDYPVEELKENQKEFRNVGRKAYKSENTGNSERSASRQVRYSQM